MTLGLGDKSVPRLASANCAARYSVAGLRAHHSVAAADSSQSRAAMAAEPKVKPGLWARFNSALDRLNLRVNDSAFGRYFQIEARKSTLTQELRAGIVCFLTVAYIIRKCHVRATRIVLLTCRASESSRARNGKGVQKAEANVDGSGGPTWPPWPPPPRVQHLLARCSAAAAAWGGAASIARLQPLPSLLDLASGSEPGKHTPLQPPRGPAPTNLRIALSALLRCTRRAAVNSGILADTGGTCEPAIDCNVSQAGLGGLWNWV
eukprot:363885-Chlamydomonas_euryale.AAC.26